MRATGVKRAWAFDPVTDVVWPGWGVTVLWDLSRSCLVHVAVREGSCWSARSRVAARTNELDADERRRIIESEEESFRAGLGRSCVSPVRGGRSDLTSTHSAGPPRGGGRP